MKKMLIILLLGAVIAISGCVGGREVTQIPTRGLTINSFSISDTQVQSGEFVLIDMEVENVGGTTARNVQADLFGVEGQWKDIFGNIVDSTLTQDLGILKPPLPAREIPGDFKLVQWQLKTPDIPQGITRDIPIEARVTYDYNTSGYMIIEAVSEDEFRRRQILGQETGMPADIVNSEGPIHLQIPERYRAPIVVFTDDESEFETHPFLFEFVNVGDGFPITPDSEGSIQGAGGRLTGTIDVLGPKGVEFYSCLGQTGGTHIDLDDTEIIVQLRANQKARVPCGIRIDKSLWGNRPRDTIKFVFNIFYRYYVSATATINVIGVR